MKLIKLILIILLINEVYPQDAEFNYDSKILESFENGNEAECNGGELRQTFFKYDNSIDTIIINHNINPDFINIIDQSSVYDNVYESYIGLDYVENVKFGIKYNVTQDSSLLYINVTSNDECDSMRLNILLPHEKSIALYEHIDNLAVLRLAWKTENAMDFNTTQIVKLSPYLCSTGPTKVYSAWKRGKNIGNVNVAIYEGKKVEVHTLCGFKKMKSARRDLTINSGFRTMAEQKYLYNCYLTKKCNNGNLAARPGYSNHQNGRALDLNVHNGRYAWLAANAGRYDFKRTVPSENWHWEYFGNGSGGGGSGGASCSVNGASGTCVKTSKCGASTGTPVPGHCRGAANIQCCIPAPRCTASGRPGRCRPTRQCRDRSVPGHCKGPSDIQCCV